MSFTGHEDHQISLADAAALTRTFRTSVPRGSRIGGFFGRDAIEAILAQTDCVGIRYYYGIDTEGYPVIVLVGVTADGSDLYNGELAEISFPCPSYCAEDNQLNS